MKPRRDNSRGFTLLELLLVMVIIVIMAAIAAPSLEKFSASRNIYNDASQIVSLAAYAQNQAIAEARTYRLNFDPQSEQVFLTYQDELPSPFKPAPGEQGQPIQLPAGVTLRAQLLNAAQGQGSWITFNPDGRVDPAIITLTPARGQPLTIACMTPTESFQLDSANGVPLDIGSQQ